MLKFIYSEKATKFCEIFPLLLSYLCSANQQSKGKIWQNFVAFSEYMNFTVQDFLIKLGIKPIMYLVEIVIFSLYHVIIRPKYQNYEESEQKLDTFLGTKNFKNQSF